MSNSDSRVTRRMIIETLQLRSAGMILWSNVLLLIFVVVSSSRRFGDGYTLQTLQVDMGMTRLKSAHIKWIRERDGAVILACRKPKKVGKQSMFWYRFLTPCYELSH